MAASALFHPVLLKPLYCPQLGLLGGLQRAFELGDIQFLGQLTKTRSGDGAQSNKLVTIKQRFRTQLDVTECFYSSTQFYQR